MEEWFKIRCIFCGDNGEKQDIPLAIELAASCNHPCAEWLRTLKGVTTKEEVLKVLEVREDMRSLFFRWYFSREREYSDLIISSDLGYPIAQANLSKYLKNIKLAELSIKGDEPFGHFALAYIYSTHGFIHDIRDNYLIAANYGIKIAMYEYALLCDHIEKWKWLIKCLPYKEDYICVNHFKGTEPSFVVFKIGQICRNDRTLDLKRSRAINFYNFQILKYQEAVHAWSLCAKRLNLYKDLRILIGKMVWESRYDAVYSLNT
jgi:hypothetical protein